MQYQKYLVSASILAFASFSQVSSAGSAFSDVFYSGDAIGGDSLSSNTGAQAALSMGDTQALADGGSLFQYGSAIANLSTGELKTYAYSKLSNTNDYQTLWQGSLVSVDPKVATHAKFGDTFYAYSGSSPFVWSPDSQVHFNFAVSGNTAPPSTPTSSFNGSYTALILNTYQSGFSSFLADIVIPARIAYVNNPTSENKAIRDGLEQQLNNMVILDKVWTLGDTNLGAGGVLFSDTPESIFLDSNGTANISYDFNPNGDFEWSLELYSIVTLDGQGGDSEGLMDFSHTVKTSYIGPDGTTTYSDSGLFPNTASISSAVPEPESYAMFLAGLGLLGFVTRRKNVVM